jgi:hypothetical protein
MKGRRTEITKPPDFGGFKQLMDNLDCFAALIEPGGVAMIRAQFQALNTSL